MKIFILASIIQLITGYCEDLCYNHTCVQLNGNVTSECGDCDLDYQCNFGNQIRYNTYLSYFDNNDEL